MGEESRRNCGGPGSDRVNPYRLGNVFDPMLAQRAVIEIEFVLYLVVGRAGQANATGGCQPLQTGCDIDAVAIKVVVIGNDDIAEIDAYAQLKMTVWTRRRAKLACSLLHRHGAGKRIDNAAEISKQPIAGSRDEPPGVAGDQRVDTAAQPPQRVIGRRLIFAHEPAVADD